MGFGSAFRPPLVGLDIGSSAVKAVVAQAGPRRLVARRRRRGADARRRHAGRRRRRARRRSATPSARCSTRCKMRRARVAAALSGHAVIVKRLSLPAMSQAELSEAIPWEAEQYIPFDLSEVQLDYQVVNTPAPTPTKSSLDVLLVAAKRDRIDDRAGVIAQTGRRPVVLDIEAFALANAYQMNYPGAHGPALGAHPHRPQRDDRLPARTRRADLHARHLDRRPGAPRRAACASSAARRRRAGGQAHPARPVPAATSARTRWPTVLREASGQLVLEVRKTIDFYRATAPVEKLSRIVLSGGAWQAVGLVDLLASEFGAPVDVFDPFRRVTRPSRGIGADVVGPGLRGGGRSRDAAGGRPMIHVNLLATTPGAAPNARLAPARTALGGRRPRAARRHGASASAAGGGTSATSAATLDAKIVDRRSRARAPEGRRRRSSTRATARKAELTERLALIERLRADEARAGRAARDGQPAACRTGSG